MLLATFRQFGPPAVNIRLVKLLLAGMLAACAISAVVGNERLQLPPLPSCQYCELVSMGLSPGAGLLESQDTRAST